MRDLVIYAAAIALAVGGLTVLIHSLFLDRSRSRRRCPKCWYSMEASSQRQAAEGETAAYFLCPECGHRIARVHDLFRTRRHWNVALASVAVLMLSIFIVIQPRVQRHGYASVTPATLLLLMLHFDESEWARQGLEYQAYHDLFGRSRMDFLDPYSPAIGRALWRWQWRWLGTTVVAHIEHAPNDFRSRDLQFRYATLLELAEEFAEDDSLSSDISAIMQRDRSSEAHRAQAIVRSADHTDVEGSLARLLPLLDDESDTVRAAALRALRVLAVRNRNGIDALFDLLKHERPDVRRDAVESIGLASIRHGMTAKMLSALGAMENDEDCDVRSARVTSLVFMLPLDEALRLVEAAMRDEEDVCVRRAGFKAAHSVNIRLSGAAPSVLEPIIDMAVNAIGDEDQWISWSSAWLLNSLAHDGRHQEILQQYASDIALHSNHEDDEFRGLISETLEAINSRQQ